MMPYGYDEIIFSWPMGRAISESLSLENINLLFAGFLSEDHISPVSYLFSSFIYYEGFDPVLTLSYATKISFVFIIFITVYLSNLLWNDYYKNLLLIIFFILCKSVFFGNYGYNFGFNLVLIFSLLTLIFLIKYQNKSKNIFLFISVIFCLIGSLTFESFFITYPIVTSFIIMNFIKRNYNMFKTIKLCLIYYSTLLPYFILHFIYFEKLLPVSRAVGEGNNYSEFIIKITKPIILIVNDNLFNIPKYILTLDNSILFLIPVLIFFSIILYKIVKQSSLNYRIFFIISILFSTITIMFTGRYHPGLWTIFSIIIILFLTDGIINYLKRSYSNSKLNISLSVLCIFLFLINYLTKPHQSMIDDYNKVFNVTNKAYELIDSSDDKIIQVRLPGSDILSHPVAFWIGNQIFKNDYGLIHMKDYNTFHMNGIDIEQYNNPKNNSFKYFNITKFDNLDKVLFKTKNTYFKILNNNKKNIFRAITFQNNNDNIFEIYIRGDVLSSNNSLNIELNFNKSDLAIKNILFNGKNVIKFEIIDNKIKFVINDYLEKNIIEINYKSNKSDLNLINVFTENNLNTLEKNDLKNKTNSSNYTFINIKDISDAGVNIFGNLNSYKNFYNNFFFESNYDSIYSYNVQIWTPNLSINRNLDYYDFKKQHFKRVFDETK